MSTKRDISRRGLLKRTVLAGTVLLAGKNILGANDEIRLAIIGLGNKGRDHVRQFSNLPGVRIAALCDVDPQRLAERVKDFEGIFSHTDPRRILDRNDIDVVVIATPDHWHALLAIWACQSGRDVYVEKPVSHNILEGRKIVEAGIKYGRIVQAGTQYRSDEGLIEAADYIREGRIGKMQWGHVVWYELRGSIGKVAPYLPDGLDYDLYCGPADKKPLRRKRLHYDWHWIWSTGTGDLGNSGIHAFDVCRWFAGYKGLPRRAVCLGGRFAVDDAGQTPNTQLTLLDYSKAPIIIENRNLPKQKGIKALDHYRQVREGIILQCEGGYFAGLRGGGWVYDNQGKRIKQFAGDGGSQHVANFLKAVRNRNANILNAPIQEGHISSACCHLGNLSYRLGSPTDSAELHNMMEKSPQVTDTIDKLQQHLHDNGVDLKKHPMICGPQLTVNEQTQEIIHVDGYDAKARLAQAKQIAHGTYRPPFLMPDKV